jgi:hypothetical protein
VIREQVNIGFKRGIIVGVTMLVLMQPMGCREDRPEGILSEKEMVEFLTEIYLAEEKVSRLGIPYDSLTRIFPRVRQDILTRTNVKDSVFLVSWNYYLDHPKKLDIIYTALIDTLNLKEQGYPVKSPTQSDAVPE